MKPLTSLVAGGRWQRDTIELCYDFKRDLARGIGN